MDIIAHKTSLHQSELGRQCRGSKLSGMVSKGLVKYFEDQQYQRPIAWADLPTTYNGNEHTPGYVEQKKWLINTKDRTEIKIRPKHH